jgi:hypothetical protein
MSGCTQLEYRVTNWHTVMQTTEGFKESLYAFGPSYWRFDVYSDFYTFWGSSPPGAVYTNGFATSRLGGHAVLIIGWDDDKGAFLAKNSWGATAGPNGDGTFWIAYDGHFNNLGFAMSNFELLGGGQDPSVDIKANGSDGPITISQGSPVSLDITIEAGDQAPGDPVEIWVIVDTPFGYYSYNRVDWVPGIQPAYTGGLLSYSGNVLNEPLPPGSYIANLALDYVPNGWPDSLDYLDVVEFEVSSSTGPSMGWDWTAFGWGVDWPYGTGAPYWETMDPGGGWTFGEMLGFTSIAGTWDAPR